MRGDEMGRVDNESGRRRRSVFTSCMRVVCVTMSFAADVAVSDSTQPREF
jgi:hypothetical protein